MRKFQIIFILLLFGAAIDGQNKTSKNEPNYEIAFAKFAPMNTDIFIADADGNKAKPLLANPESDYNASFSPDGKWIYFTSERNGSADIYRVHVDGKKLEKLTNDIAFDDQAAVSPDGKSLAFVSSRSGQADVWILDLKSKKLRNLMNNLAGDFRPAWSPDGKWLAFSSDRDSTKPKARDGFSTLLSTEIYIIRADGSDLRRLTNSQTFAGSPVWSVDGKRLAFYEAAIDEVNKIVSVQRKVGGTTQISTIDVATGERRVETSSSGEKVSPRWLSENRIAYVSRLNNAGIEFTNGAAGGRGEFNSPNWSADGKRMIFHRETNFIYPPFRPHYSRDKHFRLIRTGIFPSFAPSGDKFISNDQTAGILHNSILLINADGSAQKILFGDAEKNILAPVWSSSGNKIAFGFGQFFQMTNGAAIADIALVNSDGTNLKILTKSDGNNGFPSWSPDGKQIVYRAANKNLKGLFILDSETGATKILTKDSRDNFPAWSPDGSRIAFTSLRDNDYNIFSIAPDGTDLQRLTNAPGNDAHCAWSPDGKGIAFAGARGGFKDESVLHPLNPQPYGEIYVMRSDGSDVRMLTDDQFEAATPTWIPLRRKISKE
jgi:TolB protein